MTRLRIAALVVLTMLASWTAGARAAEPWDEYKKSFFSVDGRVIDRSQNDASHSEGQGYGMLLSVAFNDRKAFDSIWLWTRQNLGVRTDGLYAWQWGKRGNGLWAVIDYNNASDGDIIIAYALMRASEKWPDGGYDRDGLKIVAAIRTHLAVNWRGSTFIMPGYNWFAREGTVVVNPSYFIFPAFRLFAKADDKGFWEKVYSDSLRFSSETCFGSWCLPADWAVINGGKAAVDADKSPYYGYDAVRTLLHVAGEESSSLPAGASRILDFYEKTGYIPVWINLVENGVSLRDAPAGHYAVYSVAARRLGKDALSKKLAKIAGDKLKDEKENYYSFSLYLLAMYHESIFR